MLVNKTARTEDVLKLLKIIENQFGSPKQIIADNARSFAGTFYKDYPENNDIKPIQISPYSPKSNGLAERINGMMKIRLMRMCTGNADSWMRHVQDAAMHICMTDNGNLSMSPIKVLIRFRPRELVKEIALETLNNVRAQAKTNKMDKSMKMIEKYRASSRN